MTSAIHTIHDEINVGDLIQCVCSSAGSEVKRQRGENTILSPCPIGGCKGDKFAINRDGLWNCVKCGERGNALQLAQRFDMVPVKSAAPYRTEPKRSRLNQENVDRDYATWRESLRWPTVLAFLGQRGITVETAEALGLCARQAHDLTWIGFPYLRPDGRIAFVKWRAVDRKNMSRSPTKDVMPGPVVNPLFNDREIDINKPVIITEGELDAATLYQHGWHNTVSLTNGAQSWDDSWTAQLATAEEIVLAVDHDKHGDELADKLRTIFGRERVKRVSLKPHKDANDALQAGWTAEDFDRAMAAARTDPPAILRNARDLAHERADALLAGSQSRRTDTGFSKFDQTQRGLRAGELTVATADTGEGKTAFTVDLCMRLAERGAPVCFLGMEQGADATVEQLMGISQHCAAEDMNPDQLLAAPGSIPSCFYIGAEPSGDRVEQVVSAIRYAAIVHQVRLVVVDHLDFLIDVKRGESRYSAATDAVKAMHSAARDYDVHLILICQPTTESGRSRGSHKAKVQFADIAETRAARQLAHNGWAWSGDHATRRGHLFVAKARYGPARAGITIAFRFDGFRFAEAGLLEGHVAAHEGAKS